MISKIGIVEWEEDPISNWLDWRWNWWNRLVAIPVYEWPLSRWWPYQTLHPKPDVHALLAGGTGGDVWEPDEFPQVNVSLQFWINKQHQVQRISIIPICLMEFRCAISKTHLREREQFASKLISWSNIGCGMFCVPFVCVPVENPCRPPPPPPLRLSALSIYIYTNEMNEWLNFESDFSIHICKRAAYYLHVNLKYVWSHISMVHFLYGWNSFWEQHPRQRQQPNVFICTTRI